MNLCCCCIHDARQCARFHVDYDNNQTKAYASAQACTCKGAWIRMARLGQGLEGPFQICPQQRNFCIPPTHHHRSTTSPKPQISPTFLVHLPFDRVRLQSSVRAVCVQVCKLFKRARPHPRARVCARVSVSMSVRVCEKVSYTAIQRAQ